LQLCGLAILVAGALSYANIDEVDNHLKNVDVSGSPIALIVVGSIVFIVAFYGCCGAIRESHCMVVTVRDNILHNEYNFNTMYSAKIYKFTQGRGHVGKFRSDRKHYVCQLLAQVELTLQNSK
jgi:hypothetical protein